MSKAIRGLSRTSTKKNGELDEVSPGKRNKTILQPKASFGKPFGGKNKLSNMPLDDDEDQFQPMMDNIEFTGPGGFLNSGKMESARMSRNVSFKEKFG